MRAQPMSRPGPRRHFSALAVPWPRSCWCASRTAQSACAWRRALRGRANVFRPLLEEDRHAQTAAGRATAAQGPSRQRGCLVHIGCLVPHIWSRSLAQAAPRLACLSSLPASSALLRSSCELCFQRRQQSHSSALPMISWQLHPTMVVGWRTHDAATALLGRPRPHVARAFIRLWMIASNGGVHCKSNPPVQVRTMGIGGQGQVKGNRKELLSTSK